MNYNIMQDIDQNKEMKKDNDLENLSDSSESNLSSLGQNQQNYQQNYQQNQQQMREDIESINNDERSVSSYAGSDLSPEEVLKKKRLLLFKLKRLQQKGYQPSRFYDMNSSLEELTAEVESIKREANLNQGVKVAKNALVSVCSLLEYVNNKFDPADIVLDGWSEEINDDVQTGEYDEVMEEIYYKYYDKVSMGPEMKLITMIGGSAVKFHLSHTLLKTMVPNAEVLLKQNPGLKNEINNLIQKNVPEVKQAMGEINDLGRGDVQGLTQAREMRGPSDDVDDIIKEIENEANNKQSQDKITNNSTVEISF